MRIRDNCTCHVEFCDKIEIKSLKSQIDFHSSDVNDGCKIPSRTLLRSV